MIELEETGEIMSKIDLSAFYPDELQIVSIEETEDSYFITMAVNDESIQ